MPKTPDPNDLIMVEPVVKRPLARARQVEAKRMYWWFHRGDKVKINEPMLRAKIAKVKMVCSADRFVERLYNTHSLVVNVVTGEVFDGSTLV